MTSMRHMKGQSLLILRKIKKLSCKQIRFKFVIPPAKLRNYSITSQNWTGSFTNDYFGRDVAAVFSGLGRAHKGTSQFTISINPANQGVRLSRIMDHGVANQKARVYVNNAQVGTWYTGGVSLSHKARYDSFEIPASFTSGKTITIKIQFVSSANDWNEFVYDAYSHLNLSPSP
jgi:hypothetical protein